MSRRSHQGKVSEGQQGDAISTQTDNLAICETFVDSKVDLATYEDIVLSFLRKHLQKREMS